MTRLTKGMLLGKMLDAETNPILTNLDDCIKLSRDVPHGLNPRLLYRSEEVTEIKEALEPEDDGNRVPVVAIYGLAGVGKTQLALQYANNAVYNYDVVLWLPSGTKAELEKALSLFGKKYELAHYSDDDYEAALTVKNWLNRAGCKFLLVYDDVDNPRILSTLWPHAKGSIIVTTGSLSVAFKIATKPIHLQSFSQETSRKALISLTNMKPTDERESSAADSICRLLGGLPLAITQISEFIADRGCSYEEFLSLYRRSPERIHERGNLVGYNHNISSVWSPLLPALPKNTQILQSLLCFFDPDEVVERILKNPDTDLEEESLEFLSDDIDFADALRALNVLSFTNRSRITKSISTPRLVQAAVFTRLSKSQTNFFFDTAVTLLSNSLPNTWKDSGHQQGHGWEFWGKCSQVLPHVYWLVDLTKEYKLEPSNQQLFAELIFRSGTYLWEREQPTAAKYLFSFGLSLDTGRGDSVCHRAFRMLGHIALDMARPKEALDAYSETLKLKSRIAAQDSPEIADIYDSIACSYTEMGDINKAFEYTNKSIRIHEAHDPQNMARTYAILAVAHLRAENPEKAHEALTDCWRLQGLTEDKVARSKYPKHSGDIVLLARIQYAKGNKESALGLAHKSIAIRRKIFGDKSPRVVDSMYIAAGMLRGNLELASSMSLVREIVDISQGEVEMQGHSARALWTLAGLEEEMMNAVETVVLRGKAREAKRKIPGVVDKEEQDEDGAFQGLVGYMLW